MTTESIRRQIKETIEGLQKTTAKATQSRESAIKYLVELGLIEEEEASKKTTKGKK
jgi:hypothetical protein